MTGGPINSSHVMRRAGTRRCKFFARRPWNGNLARKQPTTVEAAFGYAGQPGAGCFGTLGDALTVLHFHLDVGVWDSKRLISREIMREMHTVQYAREIAAARAAGEKPKHEPWGLGPISINLAVYEFL